MHCSKSNGKSEVIQKSYMYILVECGYKVTSENIKYTLYFINIFLYFTSLYIINTYTVWNISPWI